MNSSQQVAQRTYSVIIPLYNKAAEVEQTIRSVMAQTLQPLEIVVVDDGSTDNSADVVRAIGSPLVRLISQTNAGECAARNRAIAEARGTIMALVDADDSWKPTFLEEIDSLISEWPNCGIYSTAFDIISPTGVVAANTPSERGIVDFWQRSMTSYVTIPSATAIPKQVFDTLGGFPEGMKMGGDQYTWIKIASHYGVCFSPKRLCNYSMVASNRSGAIYRAEQTPYSLEELLEAPYPSEHDNFWRGEFVAKCAIGKAITLVAKGDEEFGRRVLSRFGYTQHYRRGLRKLRWLLRLPRRLRGPAHRTYEYLAWHLAHRGL